MQGRLAWLLAFGFLPQAMLAQDIKVVVKSDMAYDHGRFRVSGTTAILP